MRFNRVIILFLTILLPLIGFSEVKRTGTPFIRNFPKTVYSGGTQNWDIAQDKKGFLYFANNNGVVRFDGFHWDFIDLGLTSPVRSVFIDSGHRIFVGLINDFGIIELNRTGKYEFRSLKPLLPEQISFSDVWRIHETDEGIIFQAFENLFVYHNDKISVFSPKEKYRFSFAIDGRVFVQDASDGLYEYRNGELSKLSWSEPLAKEEILSLQKMEENKLLIGTANGFYLYGNGGLEKWDTEANRLIQTNRLFSYASLPGNYYAFGTILNGLVISDAAGNVIQHISREKGLQNNTVLSLFPDREGNLWLGLDNGIAYIEINSPVSYISEGGNIGTGYCSIVYNNRLYLGTNQGLYVKSFDDFVAGKGEFRFVRNTEGQVWSLAVYNGVLICGHNLGTFAIENETATRISDEPGGWQYIQLKNNPDMLIGGFYNGLAVFKYQNGTWRFQRKIKGFNESSRFIYEAANGELWIGHGLKGIYKLSLNAGLDSVSSVVLFDKNSGLPSNEQNVLIPFDDDFFVSTIRGLFKFNGESGVFVPSEEMNKLFDEPGRIKTVKTDEKGNIWYISENGAGVLRKNEDLTYTKITNPFKSLDAHFVREFEFIYPYNDDNVFIGLDNGFAHYSSGFTRPYDQVYPAYITKIELSYLDSVILPETARGQRYAFPFRHNSFRFHYTTPQYENPGKTRFSYLLENYSEDWSELSSETYKDFNNLPPGRYTFRIKAVNTYETESETGSFSFEVLPPWYRSNLAYAIYAVLLVALFVLVVLFIRYRMNLSKKREQIRHRKEMEEREKKFQQQALLAEKEIVDLRNEKLQAEMVFRDKELANQTNNLIQKNRFLQKINQELQRIQSATSDGATKSKLLILKKRIEKEIDNKNQSRIFETYFEEVHKEFFEKLKARYPQLSPNDLRLCAYIRMNIPTKEIATLLNISYRGVEISRYRLRKKMELSRDVNLTTFLSGI